MNRLVSDPMTLTLTETDNCGSLNHPSRPPSRSTYAFIPFSDSNPVLRSAFYYHAPHPISFVHLIKRLICMDVICILKHLRLANCRRTCLLKIWHICKHTLLYIHLTFAFLKVVMETSNLYSN